VEISGSAVTLAPKAALSLSLAIHELATNAAKYGAFSQPTGRVAVRWIPTNDGGIKLSWSELGGPPVKPPTRVGFGTTLIERALAMETGGRANLNYLETGVHCEIFLPSSSLLKNALPKRDVGETPSKAVDAALPVMGRPYRILVAEDSFLLTTLLQDVFDELGWEMVGPATRLAGALQLAQHESIDAALLDINLDGTMSWDAATVLKARGIPFAFGTGYDVGINLPPNLAGSRVIGKPYRLDELRDVLHEIIVGHSGASGVRASVSAKPFSGTAIDG
jgi:CheY-like chemotaxis protein